MFKWILNLFKTKPAQVEADPQKAWQVSEAPYVTEVTTRPIITEEKPKTKKKRYYKPRNKKPANGESTNSKKSKPAPKKNN